jgi:5'-nucleotidase/UDP-sugar diphosphatase
MGLAQFPFLGANVFLSGGRPFTLPYIIKSFDGFKVAIMGLVTRDTIGMVNPEHIRGLFFEDEVAVARRLVPKLKERADMVIALTHLGIYDTYKRGSKRLARQVTGIDLIVDGHSHTYLKEPLTIPHQTSDHHTPIVQAWKWGLVLGRVDLRIRWKTIIDLSFRAIPINLNGHSEITANRLSQNRQNRIPQDEELQQIIQPYMIRAASFLSREVGIAEDAFLHAGIRSQETSLGRLVADSMAWCAGEDRVDFAVQNGGGIRTGIPEGPITMANIYEVIPFMNTVQVLTLQGKDVKTLFHQMARIPQGSGAFPHVSWGLTAIRHPERKTWEKIMIQGRSFDSSRLYKIATNSYLAKGGDGYKVFRRALSVSDTFMLQRDALAGYIEAQGGRIRPVIVEGLQKGHSYLFDNAIDSWIPAMSSRRGIRAGSPRAFRRW